MLNPPKNVRKANPNNCANCTYRNADESGMYCQRDPDGSPWGDEIDIHYTVCDGFKKAGK
jgi:hypothetical protein